MKPTLKIAVIAAGFAVAAWPALRAADEPAPAQPPPPPAPAAGGERSPEMRPRRWRHEAMERLEHLKQELNLTQEQSDQIAAIIKGNAPQRQAIMNNDSLSPDEKRARMWELRQGTEARIRTLLTPEQQKKFDAMPRRHGGRNGGPGGMNPPPPPPANPPGGGNT